MKDDRLLKQDVEEELASEAGLDPSKIKLALKHGMLEMSGTVGSLGEKLVAERAAARVVGEESVRSTLRVKLPVQTKRSDEDVYASCKAALFESYGVPRDAIEPRVEKGRVILDGRVRSKFEKEAALHAVYGIRGVVDVIDHVTIEKPSMFIPRKPAEFAQ